MRIYKDDKKTELTEVICNCCGKKCSVENGILKEGCLQVELPFGYFSKKDGQTHRFDLCEACYEKFSETFVVPAECEERTEMI